MAVIELVIITINIYLSVIKLLQPVLAVNLV